MGGSAVPDVFADTAAMRRQPDRRLQRLADAVGRMPAPFGPIIGGVGFDFDHWLDLAALPNGLGAWTKGNPVFGVLGPGLQPKWGIRQGKGEHAWDASADRFYASQLSATKPMQLSSYDVRTGHRLWCAKVGDVPTSARDPLGTDVLPGGDVVVLSDARGPKAQLTRLHGRDGSVQWQRTTTDVDKGDFVGSLGGGVGVAGGRPAYELADPSALDARTATADSVIGFSQRNGNQEWAYAVPAHSAASVVGSDRGAGLVVLQQRRATGAGRLVALDRHGRQLWTRTLPAGDDVALRSAVVVVKGPGALRAYAATTGRRLWQRSYPTTRQFFPYGFQLAAQPSLDADHVLLATTTDLRLLDLRSGSWQRFALPTDGISTTYWPYQVVVTDSLIAVVTNTGAVVARRTVGDR